MQAGADPANRWHMRMLQQRLVIDVLDAGPLGNGREEDRSAGARQASPGGSISARCGASREWGMGASGAAGAQKVPPPQPKRLHQWPQGHSIP